MTTSRETFRLMDRLTADQRFALECRYDGAIPHDVVAAMVGDDGVSEKSECVSVEAIRAEMEHAKHNARIAANLAKECLRDARNVSAVNGPVVGRTMARTLRQVARNHLETWARNRAVIKDCQRKLGV